MQKIQTRSKWVVWVVIAVAIAIGLTIWASTQMYEKNVFAITEDEAISIVKNQYAVSGHAVTDFAFLKYDGIYNDEPQFILYEAWLNTKSSIGKNSGMLIFGMNKGEYIANEPKDRFVWAVIFVDDIVVGEPHFDQYFVDADSGEIVAIWQKPII